MDIYLIYSNPSDYESWKQVEGHTLTEAEAIKAVETLKQSYLKARAFNDTICEARRAFEKENPSPLIRENLINIPKWPAGIGKDAITPEMRKERNEIMEKNQKTIEENSKLYAEWQLKQMEILKPIIEPVKEESWFKAWFDTGEKYVSCKAYGLVENYEYSYETCKQIEQ